MVKCIICEGKQKLNVNTNWYNLCNKHYKELYKLVNKKVEQNE